MIHCIQILPSFQHRPELYASTYDTNSCNTTNSITGTILMGRVAYMLYIMCVRYIFIMAFEFLKAYKLNKAVNDALPIAEVCNTDIFESMDLLEDFDKEDILSYWERFQDMEWIREFFNAVENFGETVVDSFIDIWSIDDIEHIEDAFHGYADSEAQFAEELVTDCYCHSEQPYWVVTDWQATWDSALRFDYDFDYDTKIIWRTAW